MPHPSSDDHRNTGAPGRIGRGVIVAFACALGSLPAACGIGDNPDSCTPVEVDLSSETNPTFGLPPSDADVITECRNGSTTYQVTFDEDTTLTFDVRAAFATRAPLVARETADGDHVDLRLTMGPWSVETAAAEALRISEVVGFDSGPIDPWTREASRPPEPALGDVRSRVMSTDLQDGIEVTMDLARQSMEDVTFVHFNIRWPVEDR